MNNIEKNHDIHYIAKASFDDVQIMDRLERGADAIEIQIGNPKTDPFMTGGGLDISLDPLPFIYSIHTPLWEGYDYPIDTDMGMHLLKKVSDRADVIVELTKQPLIIVCHLYLSVTDMKNAGLYKPLVKQMRKLADRHPGLTYVIENVTRRLADPFDNARLAEKIDRKNVGSCLDTCHAMMTIHNLHMLTVGACNPTGANDYKEYTMEDAFRACKSSCMHLHLANAINTGDGIGYGNGHGVAFTMDTQAELENILDLYEQFGYDMPVVLEVKEDDYTKAENFSSMLKMLNDIMEARKYGRNQDEQTDNSWQEKAAGLQVITA